MYNSIAEMDRETLINMAIYYREKIKKMEEIISLYKEINDNLELEVALYKKLEKLHSNSNDNDDSSEDDTEEFIDDDTEELINDNTENDNKNGGMFLGVLPLDDVLLKFMNEVINNEEEK